MSDRLAAALIELAAAIREEVRAEATPAAPPRTYSVEEAAELIGIGRTFAYREIGAGRLRATRRGRRVLVTDSALREYLDVPAAADA